MVGLWLAIQWLSHDHYWFNFTVNFSCIAVLSWSIFEHYEKSKPIRFTREEWKEAMKSALEKTKISLKNEEKDERNNN